VVPLNLRSVLTCSGASQPEVGSQMQVVPRDENRMTLGEPPNDTGWEGEEGVLLLCSTKMGQRRERGAGV
jgi:hypothetical protein